MNARAAALPAELLLRELDDLRALARALVRGDAHEPDDLVQSTVIVALERPPRRDGELGPWLRGVARRLQKLVQRGDSRRRAREAAAAATARSADPAELAQRLELVHLLVDELRALPQPYRGALLLRYFEDLGPAEIAARSGVAAATARSWLHRGLERLRERLDARTRRDRPWRALLAIWAERPSATPAPRWPMALAPIAAAGLLLGGITLAVVARTRGVGGGASSPPVLAASRAARDDEIVPPPPQPPTRTAEADTLHAALPSEREDVAATSTAAAAAPLRWIVHGRLLGLDPAVPWASALRVRGVDGRGEDQVAPVLAVPAPDGAYEAVLEAPLAALAGLAGIRVDADDPRYAPASRGVEPWTITGELARSGTRHRADVAVALAAIATGRVVDEAGRPIEGVELRAWPLAPDRALRSYVVGRTDAQGEYRLRAESTGEHHLVAERAGFRRAASRLALHRGEAVRVADLGLTSGVVIAGRVIDADGHAVAGVSIEALPRLAATTASRQELDLRVVRDAADEHGRFELRGLERGPWRVRLGAMPGAELHRALYTDLEREVEAPAAAVTLQLDVARVELEVVTTEGSACEAALVSVDGDAAIASTSEDGRATLLLPPGRRCELVVSHGGSMPRRLRLDTVAGVTRQRIELAPRRGPLLRLRLVDEEERPIACAALLLRRVGPAPASELWIVPERDDDGLRAGPLEAGRWHVEVHPGARRPGGDGGFLATSLDVELPESGGVERTLQVTAGGRLEVFAVDSNGVGLEAEAVLRDAAGERVACHWLSTEAPSLGHAGALWSTGFARADRALAPGRFRLELRHRGFRPLVTDVAIEARATTSLRLVLEREE